MGWFESLFKKKDTTEKIDFNNEQSNSTNSIVQIEDDWEVLPEFVEVDSADYPLVSAIATSIAANDPTNNQLVVRSIARKKGK